MLAMSMKSYWLVNSLIMTYQKYGAQNVQLTVQFDIPDSQDGRVILDECPFDAGVIKIIYCDAFFMPPDLSGAIG